MVQCKKLGADMKKIAFAGTFDPLTNGHLWVIEEGLNMADELVVMIAHNPAKKTLFNEHERKDMIEKSLQERNIAHKVKVELISNEYVAQAAENYDCEYLIRGIRGAMEFDYEALIQKTNTDVLMGVKTIFVMPPRDLESVSSSYVKSLIGPIGWHWQIKKFLPHAVYKAWINKYLSSYLDKYLIDNTFVFDPTNKQKLMTIVEKSYNNPDRKYHSLDHILHCLQELEKVAFKVEKYEMEQLVLAVLFHDIVYNSPDKTLSDEQHSSVFFEQFAKTINYQKTKEIADMILTTAYLSNGKKVENELEKILCSVDLAILAQPQFTYKWYQDMVRQEYDFVSDKDYIDGRTQALQTLLKKEQLYLHEFFFNYEKRARKNMQNEIKVLQSLK